MTYFLFLKARTHGKKKTQTMSGADQRTWAACEAGQCVSRVLVRERGSITCERKREREREKGSTDRRKLGSTSDDDIPGTGNRIDLKRKAFERGRFSVSSNLVTSRCDFAHGIGGRLKNGFVNTERFDKLISRVTLAKSMNHVRVSRKCITR